MAAMAVVSSQSAVMGSSVFDWTTLKAEPNKTGAVRRVVQRPTATLDELEIHITTLMPGETPHPPHQHPAEELLIIKEGTVESLVNGQLQRVGAGSSMPAIRNCTGRSHAGWMGLRRSKSHRAPRAAAASPSRMLSRLHVRMSMRISSDAGPATCGRRTSINRRSLGPGSVRCVIT
jgi:quercetin dioxygenase-like cupin family protein